MARADGRGSRGVVSALLVDLQFKSNSSANQCCLIAYWATKCRGTGFCQDLAMAPERPDVVGALEEQTGRYSRHFNAVVKHTEYKKDCYYLDVPYYAKHQASRTLRRIPMTHPILALAQEVVDTPSLHGVLSDAVSGNDLPPSYYQHTVVLDSAPSLVFPVGLYIDGVQYNRRGESTLGVTMMHMVTGARHLICCLRKSTLCKCGCRGWCTLWQVWSVVAWALAGLAKGAWPGNRHDNSAFGEGGEVWAELAGKPIGIRACLLFVKSDWGSGRTSASLGRAACKHLALSAPACRNPGYAWTLTWAVRSLGDG